MVKSSRELCKSAQNQLDFGYVWDDFTNRETTKTVIIAAFEDAQDQLVEWVEQCKADKDFGMKKLQSRLSRVHKYFLG